MNHIFYKIEKAKFEFAVELLNKLDSILQGKIMTLKDMSDELNQSGNLDTSIDYGVGKKIEGIKLAKEKIRREINDLNLKIKEYE